MAIMAPELAEAAGEAVGAGEGATGAGRAAGGRARARAKSSAAAARRAANYQWAAEPAPPPEPGPGFFDRGGRGQDYAVQGAQGFGRQGRSVAMTGNLTGGRSSHQGAILAEFVVAIALVSLAPIASDNTGTGTGASPYQANDLKRLVLIGVVYFGLALVPGENGSKVAAWLGFLVLIALGMGMMNAGTLTSVVGMFSPGGTAPPGSTSGSDTGTTGTAPNLQDAGGPNPPNVQDAGGAAAPNITSAG